MQASSLKPPQYQKAILKDLTPLLPKGWEKFGKKLISLNILTHKDCSYIINQMNEIPRITPRFLFKFQPVNENTLSNLQKNIIWFSNPRTFNDPFEFCIRLDKSKISYEDYEIYTKRMFSDFDRKIEDINFQKLKEIQNQYLESLELLYQQSKKESLGNIGVACFSEIKDDILLWSHYANKHRGFCVEFDSRHIPFNQAHKVTYSEIIHTIEDINKLIPPELEKVFHLMHTTKAKCWQYEKEWRIFLPDKQNSAFIINPEAISAIYLGSRMNREDESKIVSIFEKDKIKIFKMHESEIEYKVFVNQ